MDYYKDDKETGEKEKKKEKKKNSSTLNILSPTDTIS